MTDPREPGTQMEPGTHIYHGTCIETWTKKEQETHGEQDHWVTGTHRRTRKQAGTFTPDRGWAWVVLAASFFIDFTVDGSLYTIGSLYVEWLDDFREDRGITSWIAATQHSAMHLVALGASVFGNRWGGRWTAGVGCVLTVQGMILSVFAPNVTTLIVTLGVIQGCGLGIQSFILYIMVGQYFQRHLSLATGIAASGTGCGLLVFPPLAKLLIDTYNWRGAILILAGVNLHCLVYACAYRPVPAGYLKEGDAASGRKTRSKLLDASLLRVPSMVCVYLSGALALIGLHIPFVFLVDLCRQVGYDKHTGVLITTIIGLSSIPLRPLLGWCADRPWGHPIKIYVGAMVIGGASTMLLGFMTSFYALVICAMIFALALGSHVALMPPIIVRLVGIQGMSNAYGFFMVIRGFTALLATPLAGFLYDWTGSYASIFLVAGSGLSLSGIVCLPILCSDRLRKQHLNDANTSLTPTFQ